MKYLVLIALLTSIPSTYLHSQKKALKRARKSLKKGEFDDALVLIKEAQQHPQTVGDWNVWQVAGLIQLRRASVEPIKTGALMLNDSAFQAFDEALSLAEKHDENKGAEIIKKDMDHLHRYVLNLGVSLYNEKSYSEALRGFEQAATIKKRLGGYDSLAHFNAGLCASKIEEWKTVKKHLKVCLENEYQLKQTYRMLIQAHAALGEDYSQIIADGIAKFPDKADDYKASHLEVKLKPLYKSKDNAKALALIQEEMRLQPTNSKLHSFLINHYIRDQNEAKALEALNNYIELKPDNMALLLYMKATMLQRKGKYSQAEKVYLESITLDSNSFDTYYNLGSLYFNQGAEFNNKANTAPDGSLFDQAMEMVRMKMSKAVKYLERARKLRPEDEPTKKALIKAYTAMQDYERALELQREE